MTIIFPDFSRSKVLVAGDIMLDRYWYGTTDRISPEAPVPVVNISSIMDLPGGAANVAKNITALGSESRLLGIVGTDELAYVVQKKLNESNVMCNFIVTNRNPTIMKLRIMSRNQQLIRLDFEENFNKIDAIQLVEQIKLYLPEYNVLVLSDYNKGSLSYIEEIIKLARCMNISVIVDPKGTQFSRYRGATLLTPNLSEFEAYVGSCCDETILVNRAKEFIANYDISALLITRAEQGMMLLERDSDSPLYFPAQSKEVYDVTGAGDTVVGVLSAVLSSGKNLETACFLANLAAGLVVGQSGTATTNIVEMKKNIVSTDNYCDIHVNDNTIPFGIVDEATLKESISLVRSKGEKIVMTNGVFDVLHAGHISYLTNAKKFGDKLIVAVNSDQSTMRLKGKTRPINTLRARMLVLSALSVVDWVISFDEDTPIRLINNITPDFLIKGGDYQISDVVGSQSVINHGGEVHVLNFKTGYSTTNIIDAMKSKGIKKNIG